MASERKVSKIRIDFEDGTAIGQSGPDADKIWQYWNNGSMFMDNHGFRYSGPFLQPLADVSNPKPKPKNFQVFTKVQDSGWELYCSCDDLYAAMDEVRRLIADPLGTCSMYEIRDSKGKVVLGNDALLPRANIR